MGKQDHPLYRRWWGMKSRCNPNSASKKYKSYREKGIKVCERWQVFENFVSDMGPCPEGYTIERLNNDGDYGPSNCIWASRAAQMRNHSNNRLITFDGQTLCAMDWARKMGLRHGTLVTRLNRGWTIERALHEKI